MEDSGMQFERSLPQKWINSRWWDADTPLERFLLFLNFVAREMPLPGSFKAFILDWYVSELSEDTEIVLPIVLLACSRPATDALETSLLQSEARLDPQKQTDAVSILSDLSYGRMPSSERQGDPTQPFKTLGEALDYVALDMACALICARSTSSIMTDGIPYKALMTRYLECPDEVEQSRLKSILIAIAEGQPSHSSGFLSSSYEAITQSFDETSKWHSIQALRSVIARLRDILVTTNPHSAFRFSAAWIDSIDASLEAGDLKHKVSFAKELRFEIYNIMSLRFCRSNVAAPSPHIEEIQCWMRRKFHQWLLALRRNRNSEDAAAIVAAAAAAPASMDHGFCAAFWREAFWPTAFSDMSTRRKLAFNHLRSIVSDSSLKRSKAGRAGWSDFFALIDALNNFGHQVIEPVWVRSFPRLASATVQERVNHPYAENNVCLCESMDSPCLVALQCVLWLALRHENSSVVRMALATVLHSEILAPAAALDPIGLVNSNVTLKVEGSPNVTRSVTHSQIVHMIDKASKMNGTVQSGSTIVIPVDGVFAGVALLQPLLDVQLLTKVISACNDAWAALIEAFVEMFVCARNVNTNIVLGLLAFAKCRLSDQLPLRFILTVVSRLVSKMEVHNLGSQEKRSQSELTFQTMTVLAALAVHINEKVSCSARNGLMEIIYAIIKSARCPPPATGDDGITANLNNDYNERLAETDRMRFAVLAALCEKFAAVDSEESNSISGLSQAGHSWAYNMSSRKDTLSSQQGSSTVCSDLVDQKEEFVDGSIFRKCLELLWNTEDEAEVYERLRTVSSKFLLLELPLKTRFSLRLMGEEIPDGRSCLTPVDAVDAAFLNGPFSIEYNGVLPGALGAGYILTQIGLPNMTSLTMTVESCLPSLETTRIAFILLKKKALSAAELLYLKAVLVLFEKTFRKIFFPIDCAATTQPPHNVSLEDLKFVYRAACLFIDLVSLAKIPLPQLPIWVSPSSWASFFHKQSVLPATGKLCKPLLLLLSVLSSSSKFLEPDKRLHIRSGLEGIVHSRSILKEIAFELGVSPKDLLPFETSWITVSWRLLEESHKLGAPISDLLPDNLLTNGRFRELQQSLEATTVSNALSTVDLTFHFWSATQLAITPTSIIPAALRFIGVVSLPELVQPACDNTIAKDDTCAGSFLLEVIRSLQTFFVDLSGEAVGKHRSLFELCAGIISAPEVIMTVAKTGGGLLATYLEFLQCLLNQCTCVKSLTRVIFLPFLVAFRRVPEQYHAVFGKFFVSLLLHREGLAEPGVTNAGEVAAVATALNVGESKTASPYPFVEKIAATAMVVRIAVLNFFEESSSKKFNQTAASFAATVAADILKRLTFAVENDGLAKNKDATCAISLSKTHRFQLRLWLALGCSLPIDDAAGTRIAAIESVYGGRASLLRDVFILVDTVVPSDVRHLMEVFCCRLALAMPDDIATLVSEKLGNTNKPIQILGSYVLVAGFILLSTVSAEEMEILRQETTEAVAIVLSPAAFKTVLVKITAMTAHNNALVRGIAQSILVQLFTEELTASSDKHAGHRHTHPFLRYPRSRAAMYADLSSDSFLKAAVDFAVNNKEAKRMRDRTRDVFLSWDVAREAGLSYLLRQIEESGSLAPCEEDLRLPWTLQEALREEITLFLSEPYILAEGQCSPQTPEQDVSKMLGVTEFYRGDSDLAAGSCEVVSENHQRKINPWSMDLWSAVTGATQRQNALHSRNRTGLIVVATLIDKMPNLAGLVRTAEVFGAEKILLPSQNVLCNPGFIACSVASHNWIPIDIVSELMSIMLTSLKTNVSLVGPAILLQTLLNFKAAGYTIVAVEQTHNSVTLESYTFSHKCVLLLGAEKEGLPTDLLRVVDAAVEVPQLGVTRSLNVHVTAAIVMWEYTKQQSSLGNGHFVT